MPRKPRGLGAPRGAPACAFLPSTHSLVCLSACFPHSPYSSESPQGHLCDLLLWVFVSVVEFCSSKDRLSCNLDSRQVSLHLGKTLEKLNG